MTLEIFEDKDTTIRGRWRKFFRQCKPSILNGDEIFYVDRIDESLTTGKCKIDYQDLLKFDKTLIDVAEADRTNFQTELTLTVKELFQERHPNVRKDIEVIFTNTPIAVHVLVRCGEKNGELKQVSDNLTDLEKIDVATDYLKNKYVLRGIEETGELLCYDNGKYDVFTKTRIGAESQCILTKCNIKTTSEIRHNLIHNRIISTKDFDTEPNLLSLQNGILHIDTGKITSHTPEHNTRIQLPIDYKPDAQPTEFLAFLDQVLPDKDEQSALLENCAEPLTRKVWQQKALLLDGPGGNGKSTLFNVLRRVYGPENCSNVQIQSLENNRFARAELHNKLANFSDDISNQQLKHTGTIKSIISGDSIMAEKKGGQPFDLLNYAKLFISSNLPPESLDDSDAWFRRFVPISFNQQYLDENQILRFEDKLSRPTELSGIFNLLLEKLKLVKTGKFTILSKVEETRLRMKERSDPIREFCNTETIADSLKTVKKQTLYSTYLLWCEGKRFTPKSKKVFFSRVKTIFPMVETKQPSDGRVFAGIGLKNQIEVQKHL